MHQVPGESAPMHRGGMVFTFFKAQGLNIGASLAEDDSLGLAAQVQAKAADNGVELLLPVDVVLADAFAADAHTKIADVHDIPDGWMGLDIGPKTLHRFALEIRTCQLS